MMIGAMRIRIGARTVLAALVMLCAGGLIHAALHVHHHDEEAPGCWYCAAAAAALLPAVAGIFIAVPVRVAHLRGDAPATRPFNAAPPHLRGPPTAA